MPKAEDHELATTKKRQMVAARRKKVAALFLRGVSSHTEIAELLNLKRDTVAKDLEALAERWRDEAQRDFERAWDISWQKLEDREREVRAWFRRTQQPAEIIRTKTIAGIDDGPSITETTKEVRGQAGDGKGFASAMRDIEEQRQRLQKMMVAKQAGLRIEQTTNVQINNFSTDLLSRLKQEIDHQLGIEDKSAQDIIDLVPEPPVSHDGQDQQEATAAPEATASPRTAPDGVAGVPVEAQEGAGSGPPESPRGQGSEALGGTAGGAGEEEVGGAGTGLADERTGPSAPDAGQD